MTLIRVIHLPALGLDWSGLGLIFDMIHDGALQRLNERPVVLRRAAAVLLEVSRRALRARRVLSGTDLFTNVRFPDGPGQSFAQGSLGKQR